MWTPTALASNAQRATGTVWRVVEHQHTASTRKIVDTLDEQAVLEDILEENKPPYPPECDRLHYLLKTPFRYEPPEPNGSRFRPRGDTHGVFYASQHVRTALAEMSYHRLRFFLASPDTPFPRHEQRITVFAAKFATRKLIDLTQAPFDRDRARWTHASDYSATQRLAETAREANVEVIRYLSIRDPEAGLNVALLTPKAFANPAPLEDQTWYLHLTAKEVHCVRAGALDPTSWTFHRVEMINPGVRPRT